MENVDPTIIAIYLSLTYIILEWLVTDTTITYHPTIKPILKHPYITKLGLIRIPFTMGSVIYLLIYVIYFIERRDIPRNFKIIDLALLSLSMLVVIRSRHKYTKEDQKFIVSVCVWLIVIATAHQALTASRQYYTMNTPDGLYTIHVYDRRVSRGGRAYCLIDIGYNGRVQSKYITLRVGWDGGSVNMGIDHNIVEATIYVQNRDIYIGGIPPSMSVRLNVTADDHPLCKGRVVVYRASSDVDYSNILIFPRECDKRESWNR